jgi:hypothetical protein
MTNEDGCCATLGVVCGCGCVYRVHGKNETPTPTMPELEAKKAGGEAFATAMTPDA